MSFKLEFPHTSSGDVDWDTLGKMMCAHSLGEVLCASYVDKSYGQAEEGFIPDTDWKFVYKEDNVTAFQKTFKDSPLNAFMGRGVIDLPMDEVIRYLESYEHRKEWDRYLVEIKSVKTLSEIDFIIYMHACATNCLIKQERDFVFFERITHIGDKYIRSLVSVDLPEFPPKPNIIRAELQPGSGWVLEPYKGNNSQTLVSYLAHVDLKALPPMIVNRIIRRQPKAIHRIRKILTSTAGRLRSLSMGPRERSPWSEESLTASEKKAVLDANSEYYHKTSNQYTDDLSIDEFMGKTNVLDKVHSVIPVNLNPHTGEGLTAEDSGHMLLMSMPSDSSSSPIPRSGGSKREKLPAHHNVVGSRTGNEGTGYQRAFSSPNFAEIRLSGNIHGDRHEATALHGMHGDISAIASGGGMLWYPVAAVDAASESNHLLELDLDSDPLIEESTGLEGDSQVSFFTPQGSISGDNEHNRSGGGDDGGMDSTDNGDADVFKDDLCRVEFEDREEGIDSNGATTYPPSSNTDYFSILNDNDFVHGREEKEDLSGDDNEDEERAISLPLLTLASRSVETSALHQLRRSSSAKLLST